MARAWPIIVKLAAADDYSRLFFFFQAEDGIRDYKVTGVQTCALPICVTTTLIYLYVVPAKVAGKWSAQMPPAVSKLPATLQLKQQLTRVSGSARLDEIGRASCRERV